MTGRDPAAVQRFVEAFAATLVDGGMPRMPARVFAALLAAEHGRLTAAELAEQLQASPAAISGAVRYLRPVGMVTREREPGSRRDHFRVDSDMWHELVLQREQLFLRWERTLRDGITAVGADTGAGERLAETLAFFAFLRQEMPVLFERWRASRGAT